MEPAALSVSSGGRSVEEGVVERESGVLPRSGTTYSIIGMVSAGKQKSEESK